MFKARWMLMMALVFLLGWTSSSMYAVSDDYGFRTGIGSFLFNGMQDTPKSVSDPYALPDIPSPYDWIKEGQISVYDDKVEISVRNAVWAAFTDTNSMDPVIDYGSNAIEIVPGKPSDVHVGDIVSYSSNLVEGTIIHRVMGVGQDEEGWYAIMKGDNIKYEDPERVRFDQIRRTVVAIIY